MSTAAMFALALVLTVVSSWNGVQATAPCAWEDSAGVKYDLSRLAKAFPVLKGTGQNPYDPDDPPYEYELTVCSNHKEQCDMTHHDDGNWGKHFGNMYQWQQKDGNPKRCVVYMADWESSSWEATPLGQAGDGHGFILKMKSGASFVCGTPRELDLTFKCNPDKKESPAFEVHETQTCVYGAVIETAYACEGGGPGGSFSIGWILIIAFFSSMLLYCVVGVLFNIKSKNTSGSDSIPNIGFWREFPGLVAEGFRVTWAKISGAFGGGESYKQMPGESSGYGSTA